MVRNPARTGRSRSGWRSLSGAWLWIVPLVFFVGVALLEATHGWIGYRIAGRPVMGFTLNGQSMSWLALAARTLPSWLTAAALTPIVISAARRFPLSEGNARRNVPIHLAVAVLFATSFLLVASLLRYHLFLAGRQDITWRLTAVRYYSVYFNTFFMIYWAIVAVHSAFRRQELIHEALVLERQLAEARLHALQAQIRPHFLFNALNAISTLARAGDDRTVVRMLAGLADLLRASFRDPASPLIPLREELVLVQRYLELEKLRFAERLSVAVHADEDTLDAQVPRFLLQPIVENALRHGVAASAGHGSVTIDVRRRDDRLEFRIRDSGPGPSGDTSGGTGLRNTRGRLAQLYAEGASLDLEAVPGGGAQVTMILPFRNTAPVAAAVT